MADQHSVAESLLELTRKQDMWRDRVSRSEALLCDRQRKYEEAREQALARFGTNDPDELRAMAQQREKQLRETIAIHDRCISVMDRVLDALTTGKKVPDGVREALEQLLQDDLNPVNTVSNQDEHQSVSGDRIIEKKPMLLDPSSSDTPELSDALVGNQEEATPQAQVAVTASNLTVAQHDEVIIGSRSPKPNRLLHAQQSEASIEKPVGKPELRSSSSLRGRIKI